MANPDLIRSRRTLSLGDIGTHTVLSQGETSGSGLYFERWFKSQGVRFERILSSNSMIALVGFTLAGIGISYLPRQCFHPLVEAGKLAIIPTKPLLPPVPYAVMFQSDLRSRFTETVAQLMQRVCDFSMQYQR